MAIGDDALADGMDLVPGTADRRNGWQEINKTRDYIVQKIKAALLALWPLPISKGGTGKDTAAGALAALGGWRNSGAVAPGESPTLGWNGARLQYAIPGYVGAVNLANLSDIPAPTDVSGIYNGVLSPSIYSRGVSGSWRSLAIQVDGVLAQTASARRFKKNIAPLNVTDEQVLAMEFVEFDWISDSTHDVGLIADDVAEIFPWAVFRDENDLILGIHYDRILLAVLPVLQRALRRLDDLEGQ
ncbi:MULTISPECIES: tail fiber domain-containing protein [unclassified Microbacterium]|uniref:tail fiber domain-containing protein n=1 Tax=unclassified Microbacterium TaxID=2609290 RepID=UPI00343F0D39